MFTIAGCLVVRLGLGLGLGLALVCGWLEVVHTHLYYFRLSLSHCLVSRASLVVWWFRVLDFSLEGIRSLFLGPGSWKSLSTNIRTQDKVSTFKSHRKTHLFPISSECENRHLWLTHVLTFIGTLLVTLVVSRRLVV